MKNNIYEQMRNGTFERGNYQTYTMPDYGFYNLEVKSGILDAAGQDLSDFSKMKGDWKFHMSVHPQDLPEAWDIVANELMNQKYAMLAKVAKPETALSFANPESIQAGKHITIYTYKDVPSDIYKGLMQKLEDKLDAAGIRSGPLSNADRIIRGAKYSSYRLESGPNGEYVGSSRLEHLLREKRYNPWNSPDPYRDYKMKLGANIHPSISNRSLWKEAVTNGGERITRISVGGVNDRNAQQIFSDLERVGLAPTWKVSQTLGPTIRLSGGDVDALQNIQNDVLQPAI